MRSGHLRHLAVFAAERSAQLPDVPTVTETGFDIVVDRNAFIAGPPGLSEEVQQTLARAFAQAFREPDYGRFLEENLIVAWERDGQQVKDKLNGDLASYRSMMERFGVRFEGAP